MYIAPHSVNMALRHKHLKIDQTKLDRAKRILRLATEQDTIDRGGRKHVGELCVSVGRNFSSASRRF